MIIEEYLRDNTLIKHYSDENFIIRQIETGNEYYEAIDIVPCPFTYEETDKKIEEPKNMED